MRKKRNKLSKKKGTSYKRIDHNTSTIQAESKKEQVKGNRPNERFPVYCCAVECFCETFSAAEPRLFNHLSCGVEDVIAAEDVDVVSKLNI